MQPRTLRDVINPRLVSGHDGLATLPIGEMEASDWRSLWGLLAEDPMLLLRDAIPGLQAVHQIEIDALALGLRERNFLGSTMCFTLGDIGGRPAASFELWPSASIRLLAGILREILLWLERRGVRGDYEGAPLVTPPRSGPPETSGPAVLGDVVSALNEIPDGDLVLCRLPGGAERRPTLQGLADRAGVTRERIRQREALGRRRLDDLLTRGTLLRQRCDEASDELGSAIPVDRLADCPALVRLMGTGDMELGSDEWKLLLYALRRSEVRGWLVSGDEVAPGASSLAALCGTTDGVFGSEEVVAQSIEGAGVRGDLVSAWLQAPDLRVFDGHVLAWPRNARARARAILAVVGGPMDADQLLREVADGSEPTRGERNSVLQTVTRVSMSEVALPEWNLEPYEGLSAEILKWVETQAPQSVALHDLVSEMVESHGAAPASVRTYVRANPGLVVEDGLVRLAGTGSTGAQETAASPGLDRDVFLGDTPDSFLWLVVTDFHVVRGSGRQFPRGLFHAMGLGQGDHAALRCAGHDIPIGWQELGTGPTVGSLRRLAGDIGAAEGDVLTLLISRDRTVSASREPGFREADGLDGFIRRVLLAGDPSEPTRNLIARRAFVSGGKDAVDEFWHLAQSATLGAQRVYKAVGAPHAD